MIVDWLIAVTLGILEMDKNLDSFVSKAQSMSTTLDQLFAQALKITVFLRS